MAASLEIPEGMARRIQRRRKQSYAHSRRCLKAHQNKEQSVHFDRIDFWPLSTQTSQPEYVISFTPFTRLKPCDVRTERGKFDRLTRYPQPDSAGKLPVMKMTTALELPTDSLGIGHARAAHRIFPNRSERSLKNPKTGTALDSTRGIFETG
jgi:hypothetical protein